MMYDWRRECWRSVGISGDSPPADSAMITQAVKWIFGVKRLESVCSYNGRILIESHVVTTESGDENQCSDIIKALDPLPPLWPLPTNIKQPERDVQFLLHWSPLCDDLQKHHWPEHITLDWKTSFNDSLGANSSTQNISLRGNKFLRTQTVHILKITGREHKMRFRMESSVSSDVDSCGHVPEVTH